MAAKTPAPAATEDATEGDKQGTPAPETPAPAETDDATGGATQKTPAPEKAVRRNCTDHTTAELPFAVAAPGGEEPLKGAATTSASYDSRLTDSSHQSGAIEVAIPRSTVTDGSAAKGQGPTMPTSIRVPSAVAPGLGVQCNSLSGVAPSNHISGKWLACYNKEATQQCRNCVGECGTLSRALLASQPLQAGDYTCGQPKAVGQLHTRPQLAAQAMASAARATA